MNIPDDDLEISDEQILQWIVEDRDAVVEEIKNGKHRGEIQRLARWAENMEDPLTYPFQERLNTLGKQLQTERKRIGVSREDVAAAIGIEAETLRYLEYGWTDPTELAEVIQKWANTLLLDGDAFLKAIPGQSAQRNIF